MGNILLKFKYVKDKMIGDAYMKAGGNVANQNINGEILGGD